ncbi:YqcI/YcgG family protein [Sphingobium sp. JS3065]|uniref:guanitoxin biosynthesis heme-dependent pre-guanitoxin N-hydroxylase GntA n=1 Tax=Sphingobium sp. JS3065 TaxID=2970925 RepID=UPI002264D37D|nr:guanitoxin biosynthesis heme-dependent pre-guanitoxin N-hydroxylase GntA [Sphingobium sp. JS3065]UZW57432.1 YqcI/YcgG family protein [Sphingobium sp. JS3065]
MFPWHHRSQNHLEQALQAHITAPEFPCVGAKAAVARGKLSVLACDSIDSAWDDLRIHESLLRFTGEYREDPGLYRSFAAIFEGPTDLTEKAFEKALWERVQSLSDKDAWRGLDYDDRVSADPANPHFSLSFGGEAYFIVGLHPHASRPARRFSHPTLVFNLHDQFEQLRAGSKYEGMREKIMIRDEALAGSRNPMLERFGENSEARQYSGRAVDDGWQAPFEYHGDKS